MNHQDRILAMAVCFDQIGNHCQRLFNSAYDGQMTPEKFMERMDELKSLCDSQKARIQAITLDPISPPTPPSVPPILDTTLDTITDTKFHGNIFNNMDMYKACIQRYPLE